jgi:hypothetical protein
MREGDAPINPLTHGLVVPDEKPPVLLALVFTPLTATARVIGETEKQRLRLAPDGKGGFAAAGEIRIRGKVGVGIEAFDRAGKRDSRLGLHRAERQVDGDRVFAVQFERFDYSYTHEVEAEFDYEQAVAGRRPALNLFVPSGIVGDYHGDLPAGSGILNGGSPSAGQNEDGNGGIVDLLPGLHSLRVVATDASGNQSTASARLRVDALASSSTTSSSPDTWARPTGVSQAAAPADGLAPARASGPEPGPRVHLSSAARVATLEVEFAPPPTSPPALLLAGLPLEEIATVGPGRYAARIDARGQGPLIVRSNGADGEPRDLRIDLPWLPVPRGQAGSFAALGGRVRVDFPVRTFFEDAYLWVEEELKAPDLPPGLTAVSPVYRLEPAGLPLDRALWVGIEFESTGAAGSVPFWAEHVALYHLDPDEVSFEGREQRGPSMIGASVRHLGRFLLARDHRPPVVHLLSPGDSTVVKGGRPLLRARVRDRESGFFEDDVTFLIDGRRVPTEWNPDADDMRYRPRAPLSPGSHRIIAQATDRAGLKIERAVTISVR